MLLDRLGPPGRCSGCRRDALRYGVSFATTRSHQLARGWISRISNLAPVLGLFSKELVEVSGRASSMKASRKRLKYR
jgi:hypothetical protein